MRSRFRKIALSTLLMGFAVFINVDAQGLKDVIPHEQELKGFKITEKLEWFNPDNLWDYMNGGAPGYLAYGFRELVTFIVRHNNSGVEAIIDIYDMGMPLHAFGIFSVERPLEGPTKDMGTHRYRSDNSLYFWQDRYYVKLITYEAVPETTEILEALAEIISTKMPREGKIPGLYSAFPDAGRIPNTERYIVRDQDDLSHGYNVDYKKGNIRYRIILLVEEDTGMARNIFLKMFNRLKAAGQITHEDLNIGEGSFEYSNHIYDDIILVRKGKFIIGVFGIADRPFIRNVVEDIFGKVESLLKKGSQFK